MHWWSESSRILLRTCISNTVRALLHRHDNTDVLSTRFVRIRPGTMLKLSWTYSLGLLNVVPRRYSTLSAFRNTLVRRIGSLSLPPMHCTGGKWTVTVMDAMGRKAVYSEVSSLFLLYCCLVLVPPQLRQGSATLRRHGVVYTHAVGISNPHFGPRHLEPRLP